MKEQTVLKKLMVWSLAAAMLLSDSNIVFAAQSVMTEEQETTEDAEYYENEDTEGQETAPLYPSEEDEETETVTYTAQKETEEPEQIFMDSESIGIQITEKPYRYTGEEIRPDLLVMDGDTELQEGVDYQITYLDNTEAGIAEILVDGCGNYTGEQSLTFEILPAILTPGTLILTKHSICEAPEVQIVWNRQTLKKGQDYEADFSFSAAKRRGQVTITGQGNFTGTIKRTYQMAETELTDRDTKVEVTYEKAWKYTGDMVNAVPQSVTVNGKELTRNVHYTVSWLTAEPELEPVSVLTDEGSYYLVLTGKGNYGGSLEYPFEITSRKLMREVSAGELEDVVYDGAEHCPRPVLTDGEQELIENQDYTIQYESNTNVGTAKVIFQATESEETAYAGEKTMEFQIVPHDISAEDVSISWENSAGSTARPEPEIRMGSQLLIKDKDYALAYSFDNELNRIEIQITGIGNFGGERTEHRDANPFKDSIISSLEQTKLTYTGEELRPEVTVFDGQTQLQENEQYTVTYKANINVGTGYVIVKGIDASGYTGQTVLKFQITPKDLNDHTIQADVHRPAPNLDTVLVTDNNRTLVEQEDYTVTYETTTDGQNVTVITAAITGMGNYTGTRTASLQIHDLSTIGVKINLEYQEVDFEGHVWKPEVAVLLNDQELVEGKDYRLSYQNNLNAGTATVTANGMGDYEGSISADFVIHPIDMKKTTVTAMSPSTYFGLSNIDTKVKYLSMRLRQNVDYRIVPAESLRVGYNTVYLEGTGNYTGSVSQQLLITFPASDYLRLTGCTITDYDKNEDTVTVKVTADAAVPFSSMQNPKVFIQVPGSNGQLAYEEGSVNIEENSVTATFPADEMLRSNIMSRYALAVESAYSTTGYQQITSNDLYVDDPEINAQTEKEYQGFYAKSSTWRTSSKKGMQGVHDSATKDLNVQAALINIPLNEMIMTTTNIYRYGRDCYEPYTYKGVTYYFHNMVSYRETIIKLNGWVGDASYGAWRKNVSVDLLMGWDEELQYLIHPAARIRGKSYYALNMTDPYARQVLEALFTYMTEQLGGTSGTSEGGKHNGNQSPYKFRVCNWILGNEVNACKAWNYSGNMSTQECAYNYSLGFQMLYQAVKKVDKNARVFISLDHSWNVASDGHGSQDYLNWFAYYMQAIEPQMQWNVNFHPYSNPLPRNDFWNDYSSTNWSWGTRYISMQNLTVLTDYLSYLENAYGKEPGSIRVILGEQGYIASNWGMEGQQAAAIAYEFYLASANTRVDAMINRAYKDDPAEGIMTLGVMYQNDSPKQSYSVFKAMDQQGALDAIRGYAGYVRGSAGWEYLIPGLTENVFRQD